MKPGGTFIFSWEHPIHSRVIYDQDQLQFAHSYHEEAPKLHEAWKPTPAVFNFRRMSTFINELIAAGFQIEKLVEDVEFPNEDTSTPHSWYSKSKAERYPSTFIIKCKLVQENQD
ncbi:hypothetical protein [Cohnella faecalis]|uniref:hypothetical protein n=1 Tax=Cohnella faecalis TaxID=2315694 RepID=UPI001F23E930|nr:hypothetical protein [Cohnella faecalis]